MHVVIIGAGYCGSNVAKLLEQDDCIQVTLIDSREVQVHKIAGVRAAIRDDWFECVPIPRTHLLKKEKSRVIQSGIIQEVTDSKVFFCDGTCLEFDFLVAATGILNNSPAEPPLRLDREEIIAHYRKVANVIRKADRICVIGGGVVGVEFCGEIKSAYDTKSVTLVHSGQDLLDGTQMQLSSSFLPRVYSGLKHLGVDVILNSRVKIPKCHERGYLEGYRVLETEDGKEIETDLVLLCIGGTPNSQIFPKDWLDTRGHVAVNEFLQSTVAPNVFAVGDINNVAEDKLWVRAKSQVDVVVRNVKRATRKAPLDTVYNTERNPNIMIIPLGPGFGVANLPIPTGIFGTSISVVGKANHLFVPETFKSARATPPSIAGMGILSSFVDAVYTLFRRGGRKHTILESPLDGVLQ